MCGKKNGTNVNFTKSIEAAVCFSNTLKGVNIATLGLPFTQVFKDQKIVKMLSDRKVTISAQPKCWSDASNASQILNDQNIQNRIFGHGAEWQIEI